MDKMGLQNLSSTSIAILHTAASSRLLDCLTGVADLVASVHLLMDIFGATVNRSATRSGCDADDHSVHLTKVHKMESLCNSSNLECRMLLQTADFLGSLTHFT
jgi:hypothetical protein